MYCIHLDKEEKERVLNECFSDETDQLNFVYTYAELVPDGFLVGGNIKDDDTGDDLASFYVLLAKEHYSENEEGEETTSPQELYIQPLSTSSMYGPYDCELRFMSYEQPL